MSYSFNIGNITITFWTTYNWGEDFFDYMDFIMSKVYFIGPLEITIRHKG